MRLTLIDTIWREQEKSGAQHGSECHSTPTWRDLHLHHHVLSSEISRLSASREAEATFITRQRSTRMQTPALFFFASFFFIAR